MKKKNTYRTTKETISFDEMTEREIRYWSNLSDYGYENLCTGQRDGRLDPLDPMEEDDDNW